MSNYETYANAALECIDKSTKQGLSISGANRMVAAAQVFATLALAEATREAAKVDATSR